jgi:glycosyltransferase involved in cell wall biosynthesis
MFRGVAVVASDIGGLAEIVRHGVTGLHVPAGDEAALADALASLLADRARAEQFGEAGLARAGECFTIESSVDRFERLYDALLHREPEVVLVG